MDLISEKIEKWIPSKLDQTNINNLLLKIYTFSLGIDFSPVICQFNNRIKEINYNFLPGSTSSGAICFFGSIIMSLLQVGRINNIEELFTFSSCYILTDHYLDDDTISMNDKIDTIKKITKFIGDNKPQTVKPQTVKSQTIDSPIIQAVADKYIKMITNIPNSNHYLKELFRAEVKTMHLQTQNNLSRDEYLYICEWKGGLTCNAIQSLIGLEITDTEYILGACIQLVDDMLDINDDIKLKINSIATYDYRKDGKLDKLLIYTVNRIDNMNRKYNFFKPILLLGLILAVHTNRDKYSSEMLNIIEPYVHYDHETTKDELFGWFQHKIETYN